MKNWLRLSVGYLLIVATLGTVLRWFFVHPPAGWRYDYLLHAHSHLAMLGWAFNTLFIAFVLSFSAGNIRRYRRLFWLLQVAVAGMLFSFPFQGYAAVSIAFTTLHVFLSWWFAARFLGDTRRQRQEIAAQFAVWAVVLMVISSAGPFALGAAMAQGGSGSVFAKLSLYFYLHFQYNGWYIFGCFALLYKLLDQNGIRYVKADAKRFLVLMVLSCFLGFALSALWFQPPAWVQTAAFAAAVIQVGAVYFLWRSLRPAAAALKTLFPGSAGAFFRIAAAAFLLKVSMQAASAIPVVASFIGVARNLAIGYLHLVFLGTVTLFLLAWYAQKGMVFFGHTLARAGMWLFLCGFFISEALIFYQPLALGSGVPLFASYHQWLLGVTALMPLGLGLAFAKMFRG